jgi:hypothetical protein
VNRPHVSPRDLLGTWELARRIEDRRAQEILHVAGGTELALREDGRIVWTEWGTLTRGEASAPPIPVRRELLIERRGTPHERRNAGLEDAPSPAESAAEQESQWMVCFADGRDFHPWAPGRAVVHPCGSDRYDGIIDVRDDGTWTVTWDVTGPAKDLRIISRLRRPDAA